MLVGPNQHTGGGLARTLTRRRCGTPGLTYELPRTCTCRAVERSVLWRCDRPTFRKFLVEHVDTLVVRDYTEKRQLYYILTQHFLFKRLDRIPGV